MVVCFGHWTADMLWFSDNYSSFLEQLVKFVHWFNNYGIKDVIYSLRIRIVLYLWSIVIGLIIGLIGLN